MNYKKKICVGYEWNSNETRYKFSYKIMSSLQCFYAYIEFLLGKDLKPKLKMNVIRIICDRKLSATKSVKKNPYKKSIWKLPKSNCLLGKLYYLFEKS